MTKLTGVFVKKNNGAPRKPLWCLQEFAVEFGVDFNKLKHLVAKHNGGCPPATFPSHRTAIGPRRSYYPVKEFRAWWETVKDKV